jgi:hypothetical protein
LLLLLVCLSLVCWCVGVLGEDLAIIEEQDLLNLHIQRLHARKILGKIQQLTQSGLSDHPLSPRKFLCCVRLLAAI